MFDWIEWNDGHGSKGNLEKRGDGLVEMNVTDDRTSRDATVLVDKEQATNIILFLEAAFE